MYISTPFSHFSEHPNSINSTSTTITTHLNNPSNSDTFEQAETPLSNRYIQELGSLKQRMKSEIELIPKLETPKIEKNTSTIIHLSVELQFCHYITNLFKAMNEDKKFNRLEIFQLQYMSSTYLLDKYNESGIDKIIASGKESLTYIEQNNIKDFMDYFLSTIKSNDESSTTLYMLKTILANTGLYDNDFELLNFILYWSECVYKDPDLEFIVLEKEYLSFITAISIFKSLDIDPNVIFTLKPEQFAIFKNIISSFDVHILSKITKFICIKDLDDSIKKQIIEFLIITFCTLYIIKMTSKPDNQELFSSYFAEFICNLMFTKSEKTEVSTLNNPNATIEKSSEWFGYEFEFYNTNYGFTKAQRENCNIVIRSSWGKETEKTCKELGLDYNREKIEDYKYKITIGNQFSYYIFYDSYSVEITPEPLKMEDEYILADRKYTIEYIFDTFIFDIAKKLNLTSRSCHIHYDLRACTEYSPALLFRIFMIAQQHPEFPKLFNRLDMIHCFKYITSSACPEEKHSKKLIINKLIDRINECLESTDYQVKSGNYIGLAMFAWYFYGTSHFRPAEKDTPLNFNHIKIITNPINPALGKPESTIEYRVNGRPNNGKDVKGFTTLVKSMHKKALDDHNNGEPIKKLDSTFKDPKQYSLKEAHDAFSKFLDELPATAEDKTALWELVRV